MSQRPPDLAAVRRGKAMDALSTVGAGLAGVGLGTLFAESLRPGALALLVLGLAAHLGGMVAKHQLEANRPAAWWETYLYWGCWALIGALAAYLIWRWVA